MLTFIALIAQAGIESIAVEYLQSDVNLTQLFIDNPSATYIGYADGIFSGDLLIVSRAVLM